MPTAHSLPHFPRSPPEIDRDTAHFPPVPLSVHQSAEVDMTLGASHYPGGTLEHTRFQRRKTTLLYGNLDVGNSHDRSNSRSHRNLVVVTPPSDLPLHQGQLGHVLSTGPRNRLSQGLLMPLFSSMCGQLNAIAREYNFPSVMGLCLYLYINENGVTMTPRISEDSWHYLFGHLFETRPPSSGGWQQLPIFGRIEFDIDLNKARWFDGWILGTLRDSDPFLPVVTSEALLAAHRQRETKAESVDELPTEDRWIPTRPHTPVIKPQTEMPRHLPKKLSLVDRLDAESLHAPPKLQNHSHHSDSPRPYNLDALSLLPQSVVRQFAKSELAHRRDSQRELYPVLMTETHQPAVDVGASEPVTDMGEHSLERNFPQSVGINEHLWSMAPAGPGHLVKSVPPTPTTVTSWGPPDDERCSVISNVSRLPSPDIAERVIEDILASRPRAVWGNSFGWRSAKTWKDVYPFSATQTKSANPLQAQDLTGFMPQATQATDSPQLDTCDSLDVFTQPPPSTLSVWGESFGWQRAATWKRVYPHSIVTMEPVAPTQLRGAGGLAPKYPNLCIYPATYPYFEIYPVCTIKEDVSDPVSVLSNKSSRWSMHYPNLVIYPTVYPYFNIYPPVVKDMKLSMYPSNEGPTIADLAVEKRAIWKDSFGWENATTYRAVWRNTHTQTDPNVCLMSTGGSPDNDQTSDMIDVENIESCHQPWQLVSPFFGGDSQAKSAISYSQLEVYPTPEPVLTSKNQVPEILTNINHYPVIDIYPAVYPHFNIYPAIDLPLEVHPKVTPNDWHKPVEAKLPSSYPNFDVHGSYPHNLEHIYPSISATEPLQPRMEQEPDLHFSLYPTAQTQPPQQEHVVQDADTGDSATSPSQMHAIAEMGRETRAELRTSTSQWLEMRPRQNSKTHILLHTEVFQDGVVWTPSGYTQDLTSLTTRQPKDVQVQGVHRRPRLPRLSLGNLVVKSPDISVFPFVQPALAPTSPPHVRNTGTPSGPSLTAAESGVLHAFSPTNAFMHERASSCLSQAVQSPVSGTHRFSPSPTFTSPNHEQDSHFSTRFLPLVDRRQTIGPPLPRMTTSEFLMRLPPGLRWKEGVVLQRVRAYEQSTIERLR